MNPRTPIPTPLHPPLREARRRPSRGGEARRREFPRRSRPALSLPVCLVALACLLGGCGLLGGPAPGAVSGAESRRHPAEPTASSTAPATEAGRQTGEYQPATPEHPARNVPVPQAVRKTVERTDAGARAAVAAWAEALDYGTQTGDPGPMAELVGDDPVLNSFQDSWSWVPRIYREGDWLVGGRVTLEFTEGGVEAESETIRVVAFSYAFDSATRGTARAQAGTSIYLGSDGPKASHARVEYANGAWRLRAFLPA